MIRHATLFAAAVAASGAFFEGGLAARAESPSYTIEDVTACSKDALRLCRDKLADLDAIEVCMKEKFADLSPKCQSRFKRDK